MDLEGECHDADLEYGDRLVFTWNSDIDGILGKGDTLFDVKLGIGVHEIELTVRDRDGEGSSTTIIVTVEKPTQPPDGEDGTDGLDGGDGGNASNKEGDDDGALSGNLTLLAIILIVAIAVIVAIYIQRKKRVTPAELVSTGDETSLPEKKGTIVDIDVDMVDANGAVIAPVSGLAEGEGIIPDDRQLTKGEAPEGEEEGEGESSEDKQMVEGKDEVEDVDEGGESEDIKEDVGGEETGDEIIEEAEDLDEEIVDSDNLDVIEASTGEGA